MKTLPPLALRRATAADADRLAEAGTATFVDTFGHLYRPEDLASFLSQSHSTAAWLRTLADPAVATWVAIDGAGCVGGFAVAGPCKLPVPGPEARAGELRQLYLRREFHGRGLGTRLLETALDWLAAEGHEPLYIGVWSENFGAQRLYARYGFGKVGEYEFPVGQHRDLEFILKRPAATGQ
jgi:GNAT superfamily N-acetyltransferase